MLIFVGVTNSSKLGIRLASGSSKTTVGVMVGVRVTVGVVVVVWVKVAVGVTVAVAVARAASGPLPRVPGLTNLLPMPIIIPARMIPIPPNNNHAGKPFFSCLGASITGVFEDSISTIFSRGFFGGRIVECETGGASLNTSNVCSFSWGSVISAAGSDFGGVISCRCAGVSLPAVSASMKAGIPAKRSDGSFASMVCRTAHSQVGRCGL